MENKFAIRSTNLNDKLVSVSVWDEMITGNIRDFFKTKVINFIEGENYFLNVKIQDKLEVPSKWIELNSEALSKENTILYKYVWHSLDRLLLTINDEIKILKEWKNIDISCWKLHEKNILFLNQIVRTTIEKILFDEWYTLLHSACFVLDWKWVLIFGDKWAWKTTTLLEALNYLKAKYISNDRVFAKNIWWKLHVIWREQLDRVGLETINNISRLRSFVRKKDISKEKGKILVRNLWNIVWWWYENETDVDIIILPDIRKENWILWKDIEEIINKSIIGNVPWLWLYRDLFQQENNTSIDMTWLENIESYYLKGYSRILSFIKGLWTV